MLRRVLTSRLASPSPSQGPHLRSSSRQLGLATYPQQESLSRISQNERPSGFRSFATTNARNSSSNNGGDSSSSSSSYSGKLLGAAAIGIAGFGAGALFTQQSTSSDTKKKSSTPPTYASHAQMLAAAHEIARTLGDESTVSYDADVLEHHGHSDWSTTNSPHRAVAVVYPRSTADVSAIARICSAASVPMIPFGAGSSVEGNVSQPHSGICVDFTNMDRIIALNAADMDVVVQPGVNWVDLNNYIKKEGHALFAPLDPSPTASIGGMVSTNCSGTNAMRYGTMKDWVVNLTVVLPDGRVIKTRRRPRKTSAGYNLTGLFVGAEGTLGFVTEITMKLAPVPEDTSVAVVAFDSVGDAAKAASVLIRSGIQLGALEIMDDVQMRILNQYGSEAVRKTKWQEHGATLFMKFSGTKDAVKSDVHRVEELIKPFIGGGGKKKSAFHFAKTKQEEADLWAARKESLFTMVQIKPEGHEMWSTDVAVPISRLAEIIKHSKAECGKLGIFASVVGHVGDGNFHVAMMYDPRKPGQKDAVAKVVKDMMTKALEMEGTVSGEHAIGLGKKACLVEELGEDTIQLMRDLKRTVDPKWIMNPGKVFDP